MSDNQKKAAIRRLNDQLRCHKVGGRTYVSRGVAVLEFTSVVDILAAVASFDTFTNDNDPYGEHDCAVLTVGDHKVLFKIDYYDLTLTSGSEDPSDPKVTSRVLTIMLAEEY